MKKLFLFIAIPIVIIIGALLALVFLVNPNQFKPLIVEQAQKQTGLDLVIEGDIAWQFFPSVGFELGKTELRNPEGFSQSTMFKVESVGIDVSVMPLLSQRLEIGNITLDGAAFYLETLPDGRKNIDALTQANSTTPVSEETSTRPSATTVSGDNSANAASEWGINLAGITISNSAVEIQDKQAGSYTKLYDVSLNLSEFAVETWTKVDFSAKGENNQQTFAVEGEAEFTLSTGFTSYSLRNIDLDTRFNDPANTIDSAKIALDTFDFDKENVLRFSVNGNAAGLAIDMKGSALLQVDKAISKIAMNQLSLDATFKGPSLPQSPMKVDMTSDLSFDLTKNHLSFLLEKLTANALAFDGRADVTLKDVPQIRFSLHSPEIDLDEFLGLSQPAAEPSSTKSVSSQPQASSASKSEQQGAAEAEPDLSALKTLDVKGDIKIDKFKASNAKMQNVEAQFSINRGLAKLTSFTSNLYQGSIKATAVLDARRSPATYTAKKQIKGVKVQPLLIDVANNDKLEGTGNIDVDIKGRSLTPSGMKRNLVGTIAISFEDGAVNGINIAQLIRENYAKFKGQKAESTSEAEKTDFSAMKATLKLNKGRVSTDDLTLQSPLLRIRGNGGANYLTETVDFTVSTSIVGSLKGQGGKDIDELKDVTIPVNISGSWTDPKFKLVFDDVLKQKAQKEIDRGLKKLDEKLGEKIKDEKTRDAVNSLLKGLFN
nr:AsmA family protein [Vibrio ostreicida]